MNSKDLHIGVTTSSGAIVEFDRNGLRSHSTKQGQSAWAQSLLVEQVPEAWFDHWDSILGEVSGQFSHCFSGSRNNCFTNSMTFIYFVIIY